MTAQTLLLLTCHLLSLAHQISNSIDSLKLGLCYLPQTHTHSLVFDLKKHGYQYSSQWLIKGSL